MAEREGLGGEQQGRRLRWRDVLLVGSSAVLSGIAVVIWNRRSLEKMRTVEATPPVAKDEEFI